MKLIPMLFSTSMVQADREERKTNTRRLTGLDKINLSPNDYDIMRYRINKKGQLEAYFSCGDSVNEDYAIVTCPYGQSGDIIWVRESFNKCTKDQLTPGEYSLPRIDGLPAGEWVWVYKSESKEEHHPTKPEWGKKVWRPSIHMPYAACRTWLKITDIRVERLRDISTGDILKEGVRYGVSPREGNMASPVFRVGVANSALSFMPKNFESLPEKELEAALLYAHWAELWCEINGRESWDANPWVWRIEFERTEKPTNDTKKKQILHPVQSH